MNTQDIPTLDIDLYAPEVVADPWPLLARIREAGPMVWNRRGYWMTGSDRLCRQILAQSDTFGQQGLITSLFGEEAFISIDDRRLHNALRNVWVHAFGASGVERLVPAVRAIVADMLEGAAAKLAQDGSVDMVGALCRPLPAHVIAHMMGVAQDMIPTVIEWADLMANATASGFPIDYANDPHWLASERAKAELADYLAGQIAFRRKHPGDDLISCLVRSEIGATLSDRAMMVNIRQLLFAGNETTGNWLGHIVHTLGRFPDERGVLRRDRSLLPAALEEVLRWQGVTHVLPRGVGASGATVGEITLPPGTEVILLLGAAGRDPERWDDPDRFDIRREPKPHLAFGFGLHSCLGATLARMEALEVASALLDRFPDYRIAAPVTYGNFSLRGPTSLRIALTDA